MKNACYRIVKVKRKSKEYFLPQHRFLFCFWRTLSETVPSGFADFMELDIVCETYDEAFRQIQKHHTPPATKEYFYIGATELDANEVETHALC